MGKLAISDHELGFVVSLGSPLAEPARGYATLPTDPELEARLLRLLAGTLGLEFAVVERDPQKGVITFGCVVPEVKLEGVLRPVGTLYLDPVSGPWFDLDHCFQSITKVPVWEAHKVKSGFIAFDFRAVDASGDTLRRDSWRGSLSTTEHRFHVHGEVPDARGLALRGSAASFPVYRGSFVGRVVSLRDFRGAEIASATIRAETIDDRGAPRDRYRCVWVVEGVERSGLIRRIAGKDRLAVRELVLPRQQPTGP